MSLLVGEPKHRDYACSRLIQALASTRFGASEIPLTKWCNGEIYRWTECLNYRGSKCCIGNRYKRSIYSPQEKLGLTSCIESNLN